MTTNRYFLLTSLAVVALGGCGDVVDAVSDAGPTDASTDANIDPCAGEEIALDDFIECLQPAYCAAFECVGFSIPFCYEGATDVGFGELEQTLSFVAAGTITFDPRAAAECIQGLANVCRNGTDPFVEGGPCDAMLWGKLADGQPCYESDECGGAGSCNNQGSCELQCCLGTCEHSNRPLYAECNDSNCDPGLFCVNNPVTNHRSCQSGDLGAPCENSRDCTTDLYCSVEGNGMVGTCLADVQENDACTTDYACPVPLHCVGNDTTVATGTCKRVDQEGAECDLDSMLSFNRGCIAGFYCVGASAAVKGTCAPLPGAGESCADSQRCNAPTLYCDATDTCAQRAGVEQACDPVECEFGLFCDNVSNLCKAPLPNGSSCSDNFQCASLLCTGPMGSQVCAAPEACYAN